MGTVNRPNPNTDLTVRIFDNFTQFEANVDSNDYSVVTGFFRSVSDDSVAVENLSTALFEISVRNNIPVQTLLDQMKGQSAIQVTSTMAYYLNALRSPTTLIGVNASVTPNFYAARNVLP